MYDPPPQRKWGTNGRPRVTGLKRPAPQDIVTKTKRRARLTVSWYGGGSREVAVVTETGHWYKSDAGQVPVRWVM